MKRIINTIVYGQDIMGSRSVKMDTCKALVFKREDVDFLREYTEDFKKKPTVYVLLRKNTKQAYVGQTLDFQTRLADHVSRKEFWDEAYAFRATDQSLTKTEIEHLEEMVYEKAVSAGGYHLTNNQTPQKHYSDEEHMLRAENFLEIVEQLAPFIGCDIFIKKNVPTRRTVAQQPVRQPAKRDSNSVPVSLDGRAKIALIVDGNTVGTFVKNHFVHAVIKEYIKKYPSITVGELKDKFPRSLLGRWGRWELIENNLEEAKRVAVESGNKRHFLKPDMLLHSGDGIPFVVCSQWDAYNLPNIINLIEAEGWAYSIVQ